MPDIQDVLGDSEGTITIKVTQKSQNTFGSWFRYLTDSALIEKIQAFMEDEAQSCSMDYGCVTPEYVFRMWGGSVSLEDECG